MALERELATFEKNLPALSGSEGSWVVIKGEDILGIYDTYPLALQAGYSACKLEPFMVRKIEAPESALLVTRMLAPCHS